MEEAEDDFAEELTAYHITDDLLLSREMIPILKQFGNRAGWKPELTEAVNLVFAVFEDAGKRARMIVQEALRSA